MDERAIGLSPQALGEVFPFHFVLDGNLRFAQFGPGLLRLEPEIAKGNRIDESFDLVRPEGLLSIDLIRRFRNQAVALSNRRTGIRFLGQFRECEGESWLFLGSPWFNSAEALDASGLALSDFAVHDSVPLLLMKERAQESAFADLRLLADRLEEQRAELARTEDVYRRAIVAAQAVPYRTAASADGFEFIGERIVEMTGVAASDLTPARLESMILETATVDEAPSGENAAPDRRQNLQRDIRILAPDGTDRWLSDAFVILEDNREGEGVRIGILQDITDRKQREDRLIASEAQASQLADVVACTKNLVVIADAERRVTWVNEAFQSNLGLSLAQVVGKRLRETIDIIGSDHGQPIESAYSLLDAGHALRNETRIRTQSGDERNFLVEYLPRFDQSGQISRWILVASDVTELRKAQELLREREEQAQRLAMVVAHTDNGVVLTGVDGRIEWVNAGFQRITGFSLDEVRGQVPGHFLQSPETDAAEVQKIRDELLAHNGFRAELRNRRKDGRLYWVAIECRPMYDTAGVLSGFMAIETDITERVENEAKLREIGAELETVLRLSPDGFALFDGTGRLTYCNEAFARMLDVAPARLHDRTCEDIDRLLASVCDSSTSPVPILELAPGSLERLLLKKPERMVVARQVIRAAEGSDPLGACVLFLQDVTRDEELQRMKSDFLATAAHELRTPMTSIQGFAELLLLDSLDAETTRDIAETIHRQSTSLVRMVNQLLDLQRIEQRKGRDFEPVEQPLLPIVRESAVRLKVVGDSRSVDLSRLVDSPVRVSVDRDLLDQAVSNVLANAFKYSPGGGGISVALDERIRAGVSQVGIRIQDHGIGMTHTQQARIRERFYRANPGSGVPGTGLGMAIVDEIMRMHSGAIEVESELGVGTTMTLWLPVA